jgi:hypothetical protein
LGTYCIPGLVPVTEDIMVGCKTDKFLLAELESDKEGANRKHEMGMSVTGGEFLL